MGHPQAEAINILSGVLNELFGGDVAIKSELRRCAHVCRILGWSQRLTRFQNELDGYPDAADLPWYRKSVRGCTEWQVTGGIYTVVDTVVEDAYCSEKSPPKHVEMDLRAGIDWILSATQSGYFESTGRKSSRHIRFRNKDVETEERNVYDGRAFQTVIKNIENDVFDFASKSYAVLGYGDAVQDVWQAFRAKVEECLVPLGFGNHLDAIRSGLNSLNPQEWRNAMWSCRDILHDLATHLWRDQRDIYEYLPGQGRNGKLRVTESDYVNRLGAYLHQKGIAGRLGAYLRAEMERVYHSIITLNELDSKAHGEITLLDARVAAIGTYMILGEIATRTDMRAVTTYSDPQVSAEPGQ